MSSEQFIFGEILGGSIFLPLKVCLEFTKSSVTFMHLKNCIGKLCHANLEMVAATSESRERQHSETINIELVSLKTVCRTRNQMKRKSPEKSQQRITTRDTILGVIHTPAPIVFLDAKVIQNWKKMCCIDSETVKGLTYQVLR